MSRKIAVITMLAGKIGQGAVNKITSAIIKVIKGCSEYIKTLVENYLNNAIIDSGKVSTHHANDVHKCDH